MPRRRSEVHVGPAAAGATTPLLWAKAMADALAWRLADSPQRDGIVSKLLNSLSSTTAASYGAHVARFVRFCDAQADRPSPLPATTDTVLRWLEGDVCSHDTVRADNLQPYLSAINRIHRDCGFDELCPFFPGQRVSAPPSVWRRARLACVT